MVLHLVAADSAADETGRAAPARIGFVVSKAVGGSVVRNRVQRRLRHLVSARLSSIPVGSVLVIRALPASAASSWARLGRDLDSCLTTVAGQRGAPA